MDTICPKFEHASQLLGKRWMGLIINQLLDGPKRFSTLQEEVKVSPKVLSDRLKELEKEGIVARDVYPETPVRIEYKLTDKGASLKTIMKTIQEWAEAWQ